MPRPSDDALLMDALVQTTFATMAVLNSVAGENDLSLTQLRVLAILRDRQVRVSALAAYLGVDRSSMSGLLDRADSRGLVRRSPSATDGRVVEVTLSAAGQRLADAVYARVAESLAPMTGRLDPAQGRQLHTLLRRVIGEEWNGAS